MRPLFRPGRASVLFALPLLILACGSEAAPATETAPTAPPIGAPATGDERREPRPAGASDTPSSDAAAPAAPRWCASATAHAFCADFDGSNPTEGFTGAADVLAIGNASIIADGRSAPNAVLLTQLADTSKSLLRDIGAPAGATKGALEVDVRVDAHAPSAEQVFSLVLFSGRQTLGAVSLELGAARTSLSVVEVSSSGAAAVDEAHAAPLAPGVWMRARVGVERTSTGWTATLSIDGAPFATATVPVSSATPTTFDTMRVSLGCHFAPEADAEPFRVAIDNVLADVH